MAVHRIDAKNGQHPSQWKPVLYANIGSDEEFVKQMLELPTFVDGGNIEGDARTRAKEAILAVLVEGLMPSFLVLQKIRASVGQPLPVMDQTELYKDLSGKLWKAYKQLLQLAVKELDFDIGFLYQKDSLFKAGVDNFRKSHPLLSKLRDDYENLLKDNRNGWQAKLVEFRNEGVEHPAGDPQRFAGFYNPKTAEELFDSVWGTIVDILVPLLEVHLRFGARLVEQHPDDPGPRWPNRFRFQLPPEYKFE